VTPPNPRGGRPDSYAIPGQGPSQIPGNIPGKIPGHTLVIGRDIRLTGEISACQRLIVEGSVEADLTDIRTLEIADTGYFRGSATVEDCIVSGCFDGDLTVSGLLTVRAGGRVGGAIRYTEIEVERGGRITGRADIQEPQVVPVPPRDTSATDPTEAPRATAAPESRPA
jgi:cytoskeletal protein CcmA (bactofilin family)